MLPEEVPVFNGFVSFLKGWTPKIVFLLVSLENKPKTASKKTDRKGTKGTLTS